MHTLVPVNKPADSMLGHLTYRRPAAATVCGRTLSIQSQHGLPLSLCCFELMPLKQLLQQFMPAVHGSEDVQSVLWVPNSPVSGGSNLVLSRLCAGRVTSRRLQPVRVLLSRVSQSCT